MNVRTKRVLPIIAFAILVGVGLLLSRPEALRGDAGGGCSVDDLTSNELARNEARYLPIQVMVTLAVGLELGNDFSAYAQSVLAEDEDASSECFSADVLARNEDGSGSVKFDFGGCPNRGGVIQVDVGASPPPAEPDPEGGTPPASVFGAGPADLTFTEYVASGTHLDGTLKIDSEGGSGRVDSDLAVDFLDYAGTLDAEGPWVVDGETGVEIDMEGFYRSVTGLDWEIALVDLMLDMDCSGGGQSGELTGHHGNDFGEVTARAVYDGSCDGCAAAFVNDAEQSRVCIPDEVLP